MKGEGRGEEFGLGPSSKLVTEMAQNIIFETQTFSNRTSKMSNFAIKLNVKKEIYQEKG